MRRRTVSIGGSRQSATRADDNHDTRKKSPIMRILCGTIKKKNNLLLLLIRWLVGFYALAMNHAYRTHDRTQASGGV